MLEEQKLSKDAARMRKYRMFGPKMQHSDLVFGFIAQRQCDLCGDGMEHLTRKCKIHPNLCNSCESEYCECQSPRAELKPLDEILDMPEEKRVPFLRARKMTLRLTGKKATAMPFIGKERKEGIMYLQILRERGEYDMDGEEDPGSHNMRAIVEGDFDVDR